MPLCNAPLCAWAHPNAPMHTHMPLCPSMHAPECPCMGTHTCASVSGYGLRLRVHLEAKNRLSAGSDPEPRPEYNQTAKIKKSSKKHKKNSIFFW